MGLDAVVFKNIKSLEKALGAGLFQVDAATGEVIPKANVGNRIPRNAYFALTIRIGNAAEVGWLHTAIGKYLAAGKSLVMDRILYSASHSGDSIKVAECSQLRKEIDLLRSQNLNGLQSFVDAMDSLLRVAEEESNPIVFT